MAITTLLQLQSALLIVLQIPVNLEQPHTLLSSIPLKALARKRHLASFRLSIAWVSPQLISNTKINRSIEAAMSFRRKSLAGAALEARSIQALTISTSTMALAHLTTTIAATLLNHPLQSVFSVIATCSVAYLRRTAYVTRGLRRFISIQCRL